MAEKIYELANTSLTDSLTAALREAILAGEIEPNERLSENTVGDMFGVARVTARAGIDRLVAAGLLRRGRRKAAYVPLLSASDISDIYFSREPIEIAAAEWLTERGVLPEGMIVALEGMKEASGSGDGTRHTEADIAMHRAMVVAVGSPRLCQMHDLVLGETQLCISQVRRHSEVDLRALTEIHASIVDAIRDRDAAGAVRALRLDLHGCRDILVEAAKADRAVIEKEAAD